MPTFTLPGASGRPFPSARRTRWRSCRRFCGSRGQLKARRGRASAARDLCRAAARRDPGQIWLQPSVQQTLRHSRSGTPCPSQLQGASTDGYLLGSYVEESVRSASGWSQVAGSAPLRSAARKWDASLQVACRRHMPYDWSSESPHAGADWRTSLGRSHTQRPIRLSHRWVTESSCKADRVASQTHPSGRERRTVQRSHYPAAVAPADAHHAPRLRPTAARRTGEGGSPASRAMSWYVSSRQGHTPTRMMLDGLFGWGWLINVATLFTVSGSPLLSSPSVTCTSSIDERGEPRRPPAAGSCSDGVGVSRATLTGLPMNRPASPMQWPSPGRQPRGKRGGRQSQWGALACQVGCIFPCGPHAV